MLARHFFAVVELRTKIVSASTWTMAVLYAAWRGWRPDPLRAALAGLAALAVDMGTTAFNSYFDWYRNVDDPRFNRERDKVIVHEGLSPGTALGMAAACYAVAVALGLVLVSMTTPWLAVAGAACLAVGFLYSGGPRPISSTPFGELFAGGFLGTAFFAIAVSAMTGRLDGQVFLASVPQALFIASILAVNNACDLEGDIAAGRRTLAIVLGRRASTLPVSLFAAGAHLAAAAIALAGYLPRACALAAAVAAMPTACLLVGMNRRGFSHATKGRNMGAISRAFLMWSLTTSAGYVAGILGT